MKYRSKRKDTNKWTIVIDLSHTELNGFYVCFHEAAVYKKTLHIDFDDIYDIKSSSFLRKLMRLWPPAAVTLLNVCVWTRVCVCVCVCLCVLVSDIWIEFISLYYYKSKPQHIDQPYKFFTAFDKRCFNALQEKIRR